MVGEVCEGQEGGITCVHAPESQVPSSLLPGARAGKLAPAPAPAGPLRLAVQPPQALEPVVGPHLLV